MIYDIDGRPIMPPDVQKYMIENGYELYNACGRWFVVGDGVELIPELFVSIYNKYKNKR